MNEHEARLHAMLDEENGWFGLNDEDRAAIRWIIDHAIKLQDRLDEANRYWNHEISKSDKMRDAAMKASAEFMKIAVNP